MFTAKGGTSSNDGLFQRYELEIPATLENWYSLRQTLEAEGAVFRRGSDDGQPSDWLTATGMVTTQHRATHRVARDALAENGEPVAEVALDKTQFRFGPHTFDYWEIEIEQIDPNVDPHDIGVHLLAMFPDRLELSMMGKYSRGLVIEQELRAAGKLQGMAALPTRPVGERVADVACRKLRRIHHHLRPALLKHRNHRILQATIDVPGQPPPERLDV